ncbi:MAG: IgGFc-binding protein [Myxococcota bacterium]
MPFSDLRASRSRRAHRRGGSRHHALGRGPLGLAWAGGVGGVIAGYGALVFFGGCSFESGLRWLPPLGRPAPVATCEVGDARCNLVGVETCREGDDGVARFTLTEDCAADGKICAPDLLTCVTCLPNEGFCDGQDARRCGADGESSTYLTTCDPSAAQACRGGVCLDLCDQAAVERSNVGCEYWAVDLDNAALSLTRNAAAQQYAVVMSNPQPDVPVEVVITRDDGVPGGPIEEVEVARAVIAPLNLRVFRLGPREVDGSPPGEYGTGTHTALTRAAFRITSDFPVVGYQFNPLENVNVFSNDASLLKPVEALARDGGNVSPAYVVAGWPQTIAITDDPDTNFPGDPINLRAFLTIVGTREETRVLVQPTTETRAGDGIVAGGPSAPAIELTLGPYEVANLETNDLNAFNADFTGTIVSSDKPVAVFSGSEASDAPRFDTLSERRCCADHLEEQLDPIRTAGQRFAIAHSPSRTATVLAAGGELGTAPEPEYVRFVATREDPTVITTSLAPPRDTLRLEGIGDFVDVAVFGDFVAESTRPVHVAQILASQDAANVPRGLPGGDPSLVIVPPIEQYRASYVFLTPDKYAFDFVTIVAPTSAQVFLDEREVDGSQCEVAPADGLSDEDRGGPPALVVYRCQFSFGVVDPDTGEVTEGTQDDGVHRVIASEPVGIVVYGFDAFVSYAYAGGTDLRAIAPPL